MNDWMLDALLFIFGIVAGTLNVIAGGGTFLTLPLLIFMGLPASVANGTIRLGIITQNLGAVWGFHRRRVLPWEYLAATGIPGVVGAVAGAFLAIRIDDASFKRILAIAMVVVALWSFWNPRRRAEASSRPNLNLPLLIPAFFLVGLYGGFIQAGVGFFILSATTFAGLDLVRGNAVKVLSVLFYSPVTLAIFAWDGSVDWWLGSILAVGMLLGGQIGVHLTVLKGHKWVRGVVTAAILVFALKLWLTG